MPLCLLRITDPTYTTKTNPNKIIVQIMIKTGPANPAKTPPNLKSFCSSNPVEYAIAFGGVETGKNKAHDAANPITSGNKRGINPSP